MNIGKLGAFVYADALDARGSASLARDIERWGYKVLWYPEAFGRDSIAQGAWLLTQTSTLVVASGIANIYARDAHAAGSARLALNEFSDGRFLLGLGVSHTPLVECVRGHREGKPIQVMSDYLDGIANVHYMSPKPKENGEVVLAALRTRMLELSRDKADGALPLHVTPEHTRRARAILGPGKKLYVVQKVSLETDRDRAHAAAYESLKFYLTLPNYVNSWLEEGFTREELEPAKPSARFLDAMVFWGKEAVVRARIEEHFVAGADHVALQPVGHERALFEVFAPGA